MTKALFLGLLFLQLSAAAPTSTPTRVIVLGIAQDGGIPHLGCYQEICRTQTHYVSSLAIIQDSRVYLIDASPDLRQQHRELVRKEPSIAKKNIADGIFLTHAHMGHYAGLLYLGKESIATTSLPVYCSSEMRSYLQHNAPWSMLAENKNIELQTFVADQPVELGFTIIPVAVPHRKEFTDTFGFLIRGSQKSLLYIPDIDSWEPVKDSIFRWMDEVDYALVDGTFYSGHELPGRDMSTVPHPTIESSILFFNSMKDRKAEIFFTHLNHTNPVLIPESNEAANVARAGYKIAVDWQEFAL